MTTIISDEKGHNTGQYLYDNLIPSPDKNLSRFARIFAPRQGSADDAGQDGPLGGADAGLGQKDRKDDRFLSGIGITSDKSTSNIKFISLQGVNIKPCYGCGGCTEKTFLRCVVRDDADYILPYIAQSEIVIIVTRITYGGYSFEMKRLADKFSPLVTIHYGYKNGELVKGLHDSKLRFFAVGVHDNATGEEQQAFGFLVNETLNITRWSGKPLIVKSGTTDIGSVVKEEI